MKLEDQVCTLEQAKKLMELGITKDTDFTWCCIMPDPTGENYYYGVIYRHEEPTTLMEAIAPAFTAAELGVMLPGGFNSFKDPIRGWYCERIIGACRGPFLTEAQARAAMLIEILKYGEFPITEVNARLND